MSARRRKKRVVGVVGGAMGLHIIALLAVVSAWLAILGVKLANAPMLPWQQLFPLLIYAVGVPLVLLWMKLVGWQGDSGFVGAVFLLTGVGVTIQFRMGSFGVGSDDLWALLPLPLGMAAFMGGVAAIGRGGSEWLRRGRWLYLAGALGALAVMLVFGRRYRGGVYLPGNMNPSEVVKPLLVLFMASFLGGERRVVKRGGRVAKRDVVTSGEVLLGAALWVPAFLLVLLLKDLGLAFVLVVVLIAMVWLLKPGLGVVAALGSLIGGAVIYAIPVISSHARVRVDVWLNPYSDPTGRSWQILQGLAAMYSGGWWGSGLGSGAPQSVPIVSSDFVYAAVAEEIGLVGCGLLLLAYMVVYSRGYRAAAVSRGLFGRLLGVGLTTALAFQSILNIGGVCKVIPLTGITLPLLSHGGSSLVTTLFMCGVVAGLSDAESS